MENIQFSSLSQKLMMMSINKDGIKRQTWMNEHLSGEMKYEETMGFIGICNGDQSQSGQPQQEISKDS